MSDHLPEDLDRWPSTPRAVLNVTSTADKSEIRRAYSMLIRRFRPETHPRHFQRVREAMELLLAGLEHASPRSSLDLDLPPMMESTSSTVRPLSEYDPQPKQGSRIVPAGHNESAFESQRDQIWADYSRQPTAECLQRLFDLASRSEFDPTPFIMGCWAARLSPELSPDRRPFDWLQAGLKKFGGEPELIELLVGEFRDDATLLKEETSGQLTDDIRSSELLQAYLSARWRLLAQQNLWKQISREFDKAQKKISYSHPEVWFQIVQRAFELGVLASDGDGRLLALNARRELQALASARSVDRQSDYADILEFIRKSYQNQFATDDRRLDELVLDFPVLNPDQFHLRILDFVRSYIDIPTRLLQILTHLATQLPESLWLLSTHPQAWGMDTHAESTRDHNLVSAVELFLKQSGQLDYGNLRPEVAEFCRHECINSTMLIDMLQQLHSSQSSQIAGMIAANISRDLSLLLTCEWIWIFLHTTGPPDQV